MLYRYEIPLAVAGLVLVRWLPALLSPRSCPTPPAPAPLPRPAKLLLLFSSLHRLHLLLFPPFHLFTHHNIPILAHNTLLRDALETDNGPSPLADLLLARLKVLDNRYLYARLGHRPLLECLWCTRPADYFLFALPSVLWPYLCEAVVLGMLSWRAVGGAWAGRRAERWRGVMAWVLLGAAVGEIGVKWGWDVVAVEGDCVHVRPIYRWQSSDKRPFLYRLYTDMFSHRLRRRYIPSALYSSSCFPSYTCSFPSLPRRLTDRRHRLSCRTSRLSSLRFITRLSRAQLYRTLHNYVQPHRQSARGIVSTQTR